jgi:ABC-type glycerol-3-phosphate transport system substrate-binding protein
MKFKVLFVLVLAFMLTDLAFAGGGQQADSKGPVTLALWHRWSGLNENTLNEVTGAFMAKNPDIKVETSHQGGEYDELLQKMIADTAAGNPSPELFVGGYNFMNYVHDELNPVLVNNLAPGADAYREMANRYQTNIFKLGEVAGDQIGLPYALSTCVMYYNEDIFKAAGLGEADVPKTWEDIIKIGPIIKQKTGKFAIAITIVDNWADLSIIYCNGGKTVSDDGKKMAFNDPNSVEAIKMWQNLHQLGLAPVSTNAEIMNSFAAGNIAMYVTTIMVIDSLESQAKFSLRVTDFPAFGTKRRVLATGGSAIISFAKDKSKYNAIWKFLDFAASQEGMTIFTKTGYICPIKAEVPIRRGQEVAYRQFEFAVPWTNWPGGPTSLEIQRLYINKRNEIIHGNLDVQRTLDQLAADCNKLLN